MEYHKVPFLDDLEFVLSNIISIKREVDITFYCCKKYPSLGLKMDLILMYEENGDIHLIFNFKLSLEEFNN